MSKLKFICTLILRHYFNYHKQTRLLPRRLAAFGCMLVTGLNIRRSAGLFHCSKQDRGVFISLTVEKIRNPIWLPDVRTHMIK